MVRLILADASVRLFALTVTSILKPPREVSSFPFGLCNIVAAAATLTISVYAIQSFVVSVSGFTGTFTVSRGFREDLSSSFGLLITIPSMRRGTAFGAWRNGILRSGGVTPGGGLTLSIIVEYTISDRTSWILSISDEERLESNWRDKVWKYLD